MAKTRMTKTERLERIMKVICNELGIQEAVDITLGRNSARIYFTFEAGGGEGVYLNTTGTDMEEVCRVPGGIADRYGLQRDKSNPKYKPGNRFALGFKLRGR